MKEKTAFLVLVTVLIAIASFFLWRETHTNSVPTPHPVLPPPTKPTAKPTLPHPAPHTTPASRYRFKRNGVPTEAEKVKSVSECNTAVQDMNLSMPNKKVFSWHTSSLPTGCFQNNTNFYYNTSASTFPCDGAFACIVRTS